MKLKIKTLSEKKKGEIVEAAINKGFPIQENYSREEVRYILLTSKSVDLGHFLRLTEDKTFDAEDLRDEIMETINYIQPDFIEHYYKVEKKELTENKKDVSK